MGGTPRLDKDECDSPRRAKGGRFSTAEGRSRDADHLPFPLNIPYWLSPRWRRNQRGGKRRIKTSIGSPYIALIIPVPPTAMLQPPGGSNWSAHPCPVKQMMASKQHLFKLRVFNKCTQQNNRLKPTRRNSSIDLRPEGMR